MPESLKLVVAHGDPDTRLSLRSAVQSSYTIIAECETAGDFRLAVLDQSPDLLITGIEFPDGDGLDVVIELASSKPLPAVVVTSKRSLALVEKAMQDHVMAYLIEPVEPDGLKAAIMLAMGRFEQLNELASEVSDLKQALEDRKIIERAKGMLMAGQNLSESEAFTALRTTAQNDRIRLVEAAHRLLADQA